MTTDVNDAGPLRPETIILGSRNRGRSKGADRTPTGWNTLFRRSHESVRGRIAAFSADFGLRTNEFAYLAMGHRSALFGLAVLLSITCFLEAGVPLVLHFQGHIASAEEPVDGNGAFKFALIDSEGAASWSNSLIAEGETEPSLSVNVGVDRGFYAVRLGDATLPNMEPLSLNHFQVEGLKLRVWFDDGTAGFQVLTPDEPIAAAAFAVSSHHAEQADVANEVPDGLIEERHLSETLASQIQLLNDQVESIQEFVDSMTVSFSSLAAVSTDPADSILGDAGFERFSSFSESAWQSASTIGAPLPRHDHTSVWTGSEVLVWGGSLLGDLRGDLGARYLLQANQWRPLSPVNAPADRRRHSGVWTGSEFIVWGGFGIPGFLATGGLFDPVASRWGFISSLNAPSERADHEAVWTGTHMIVWGGLNGTGPLGDGGLYDPILNSWTALPQLDAPEARFEHAAIWAGDRLLIWGGRDAIGRPLQTGAQLVFENGSPTEWLPINSDGAPGARAQFGAVWAGDRMIVWGGLGTNLLGDGAAYDPANDVWLPVSETEGPTPRALHSAVWTGTEMLVFGGNTSVGATASSHAFDPVSNRWRGLTFSGSPVARSDASAVWTGEELVVVGGRQNGARVASLQRLNPRRSVHLYRMP